MPLETCDLVVGLSGKAALTVEDPFCFLAARPATQVR